MSGGSEEYCINCTSQRIPPSLAKDAPKVYTAKFNAWSKSNSGKDKSEFKGKMYQDDKPQVTRAQFWDYIRCHQNQLTPPPSLA